MKLLRIIEESIDERHIAEAASTMADGGIVVYPTDTIYAIGCDALNNQAIERICAIKGIKSAKSNLSIICHSLSEVAHYAKVSNEQYRMMKANLPGPFTFILPALSRLPKAFKGRRTVGIRIPQNAIALAIEEALGRPILTTSVEAADSDYMCEPELMAERYAGWADLIIDGGRGGTEPSTIVDCTGNEAEITREGKGILA
mgnify:FL=1